MPRPWQIAAFVCLLMPSAWLAWTHRDVPHLGPLHDDSLYYVGAKSIAERGEYRILSLPGEPYQTKYPPLYPAYLALAWKLEPQFPRNLPWAMLLQWLWMPALLALVWRGVRLEGKLQWALLAMLACAPYVNFFGIHLMTETMAASLALAACLAASRAPWASGLLSGAAFLTKTACFPLLAVMPLTYALQKKWRDAAIFLATGLPAFLGWTWWSGTHRLVTGDPALLYYTNYAAIYLRDLNAVGLPVIVWKNISTFLVSTGQCMVFTLADNGLTLNLARSLGLLAVVGTVRLIKRQGWRQPYFLFAALYTLQLLAWNYPPDPRFVLPIVPLLMAGFLTELAALAAIFQKAWHSRKKDERIFARVAAPALACAGLAAIAANLHGAFSHLPAELASQRARVAQAQAAYTWIRRQAPPDARFYSNFDPVLYLQTGRPAMRLPMPAAYAYVEDRPAIQKLAYDVTGFAAQRHLDFVFLSKREPQSLLTDEERDQLWRHNAAAAIFRHGDIAIARVGGGHPAGQRAALTPGR